MAIERTSISASDASRRQNHWRRGRNAGGAALWRGMVRLPGNTVFAIALALATLGLSREPVVARVLTEEDLEQVSQIKTSFTKVASDIVQSLRRPDISSGDSECINSTLRELMQISEELASYEYLITIETQISDFGDDAAMRGILRFAVDRAISILEAERRRLSQLVDQCSRFPLAAAKTRDAVQFIDRTAAILKSLRPRL
jgi:hypothetical protein